MYMIVCGDIINRLRTASDPLNASNEQQPENYKRYVM